MGRKKLRPIRSGGILNEVNSTTSSSPRHDLATNELSGSVKASNSEGSPISENSKPFFVEIDRSHWFSDEHLDIAEIVLKDVKFANGYTVHRLLEDKCQESSIFVRFRLPKVDDDWFRLGHFPVLSSEDIHLEFCSLENCCSDDSITPTVILSGIFDGPDESISGLVHLVSQKLLTLRPVLEDRDPTKLLTFRLRIEILRTAFDACHSLLEVPRQPWRKSMMNVMSWIRPEVTTSEAKYRMSQLDSSGLRRCQEMTGEFGPRIPSGFDVVGFYEAVKPSKESPMLEDELPDLLPRLRPYQRRAAYWMVQREMGLPESSEGITQDMFFAPLCMPVVFLEGNSKMFYNPFCGTVSLQSEPSPLHVCGGILADEMGLGKTVELLACIFSHRMPSVEERIFSDNESQGVNFEIKRVKQERVECVCGAVTESRTYKGIWVQCDICDAWQHADCVNYLPKKKSRSHKGSKGKTSLEKDLSDNVKRGPKMRGSSKIVEIDGDYICSLCSELIEAAHSTITSCATLIVCPAPILAQWYSEITRHTRPGSLKTCIYEGARNLDPSTTLTTYMAKLTSADIVLTTYDVLKEDLSHDSDRHDGDRRCMRFQKRYPVVPTLLTRIFWWRLCLDEAQMVESNTAAVTEMALRLCARHRWCVTGTPIQRRLDDIYGLLCFLSTSPFDVYRWWGEVIRDPYEKRDVLAMEFTHNFFKQIMWRSSKAYVSEELGLPQQEECMSWLSLSPVEEHFYRKQHETCTGYAQEVIERCKDNFLKRNRAPGIDASCDTFLSHSEAASLLSPLLKLRQACCHPQVGSSGLRSLQQSPMTMDEILEVLISKAKIEGEEALRRIIVALNGLAAIAVIEQDSDQAVSLYREALSIAEENSDDFRVDPLLSLHIHYNLADFLPVTSEYLQTSALLEPCAESSEKKTSEQFNNGKFDQCNVKRRKTDKDNLSSIAVDFPLEQYAYSGFAPDLSALGVNDEGGMGCSDKSYRSFKGGGLRKKCESIKQKYLSVFISKLSLAQQEFKNSHKQVCNLFIELRSQCENWWLEALNHVEQNKDFSEGLIKKIDQSISGSVSGTSRVSSRFRSITGLKYIIQTGLDSLESSRKTLFERLLEIDQTMDKPKEEDIERVRFCPNCQSGDGPLCIHCELDGLFQVHEARLFHLKKGNYTVASAEEAIDLQKKKNELNFFFRASKFTDSNSPEEMNKGQRNVSTNVVVSRSPSDLEVVLGVIKSYTKSQLGRDEASSATKQLLLFEAMRKEFAHARSLSSAQAQILRAHDEIKMSTSRLRLRETETEPTATNVLSKEELIPSGMQFSSDKFMSLSSLARIKGQLRYLKGLVLSKQKAELATTCPGLQGADDSETSKTCAREHDGNLHRVDDEPCPICHEKLDTQKMVFQCGHVTCCKCFLELTEQAVARSGKCQQKWVMCPTCRQHTDFGNVAYVDDKQTKDSEMMSNSFHGHEMSEISIKVQGSYGTKVEAITRRILWIRSMDQEAKVLVFSSWNDVLDVLEHAFHANSISYVRMKGGRKSQVAIAQFKGQKIGSLDESGSTKNMNSKSKSIQVLLLLIQHGANGLNLLEAQHVILVEPLLNPAAEAQAINRVHRIGQEKKTFVHRFIVRNTVEESIYKLNRSRNMNTIISTKSKNQDQPHITLRDVESLFYPIAPPEPLESDVPVGSLRHLPPAVAAGLAAERRLMEASS